MIDEHGVLQFIRSDGAFRVCCQRRAELVGEMGAGQSSLNRAVRGSAVMARVFTIGYMMNVYDSTSKNRTTLDVLGLGSLDPNYGRPNRGRVKHARVPELP